MKKALRAMRKRFCVSEEDERENFKFLKEIEKDMKERTEEIENRIRKSFKEGYRKAIDRYGKK